MDSGEPQPRPNHDDRLEQARAWLRSLPGLPNADAPLSPLAGDASFRRYFRVGAAGDSQILMDAPPDRESTQPFVNVCTRLRSGGVHAPEIQAQDPDQGFLLLEDLGDLLLREELDTGTADSWFPRLFDLLERFAVNVDASGLPGYDRQRLLEEMELFPNWYMERHRGLRLSSGDRDIWEDLCTRLIESAHEQPAVFVHKDFHSCNLLVLPDGTLGVIDFQDAVRGPLSYDLVSLLWDRYISWPRNTLEAWMEEFRQRLAPGTDRGTWVRWCDWMGLQRNLKVVGIFARLHYRDRKQGYLEMVPRFWGYLIDVLPRYPELEDFIGCLERLRCAP